MNKFFIPVLIFFWCFFACWCKTTQKLDKGCNPSTIEPIIYKSDTNLFVKDTNTPKDSIKIYE